LIISAVLAFFLELSLSYLSAFYAPTGFFFFGLTFIHVLMCMHIAKGSVNSSGLE
jgi:hypothetical protein